MTLSVKCVKCGRVGSLTVKKTKTRDKYYQYYYTQHYLKENNKIEWCYIGSYDKLPEEYKEKIDEIQTIHNHTQQYEDYTQRQDSLKSTSISQNRNVSQCGCGLVWSRIEAFQASSPGSNPGSRTTHDTTTTH